MCPNPRNIDIPFPYPRCCLFEVRRNAYLDQYFGQRIEIINCHVFSAAKSTLYRDLVSVFWFDLWVDCSQPAKKGTGDFHSKACLALSLSGVFFSQSPCWSLQLFSFLTLRMFSTTPETCVSFSPWQARFLSIRNLIKHFSSLISQYLPLVASLKIALQVCIDCSQILAIL